VHVQEAMIRKSIDEWLEISKKDGPIQMRPLIRDLNLATSHAVFLGRYLTDDIRKPFCDDYARMNDGLLCMPFSFPGSTLWYAIRARKRVMALLSTLVAASKKRMKKAQTDTSEQPDCMLDFWMVETVARIDEWELAKAASSDPDSIPAPDHSTDYEVAHTLLDFLFASQDASSSSLTWVCHFLTKNPEVLARVREEQKGLDIADQPMDLTILNSMPYTRQVVREVLRIRAPATLVPHMTLNDFQLREDVTIPKGTLVIPSVYSSSFQGFTNPHTFDPDRFSPERKEDVVYKKHFLVFGAGPHRCLGYEYAMLHLLAFTALFATHVNFERVWSAKSEEIVYGPTIYPGDGCPLTLTRREVD